ncbi:Uncharacterised protein [Candidatus Bilamarchaeum dharawalense]|uniref:Uncharacterized protein n=1 Tax=Candidatus Bilamarchaeum dharawalense TaxID=2885759 RepID=A0A5E4LSD8_9ARCH|nr:Uncharacterised protein [Candidatus Bilamarchaeum dharawalense]
MRLLIMFLIIASLCMAFTVKPTYIAVKNTGNESLEPPKVELLIDCATKQLKATISSEDDQVIQNAKTYIFYTNYGYQLIGTGTSNSEGVSTINVIGTMNYLTALFIFRVDAPGYRSQEIEFTYKKCFDAPPVVEPDEPPLPPSENYTAPPPENESQPPPEEHVTPPPYNNPPEQQPVQNPEPQTANCPFGALLFLALFYKIMVKQ